MTLKITIFLPDGCINDSGQDQTLGSVDDISRKWEVAGCLISTSLKPKVSIVLKMANFAQCDSTQVK